MPLEAPPARLATLDGWRAVAILLVIWCHAGMGPWTSEAAFESGAWTHYGAFGVDIFFGISGLLITKLLLEEKDRFGSISLGGFYIRRAFRILPPCFVYLAAVAGAVGLASKWELVSSVFFFRNYLPSALGSRATGHLWSLAVEEHFYLFWPALLIWLLRRPSEAAVRTAWLSIGVALWRIAEAGNHLTEGLLAVSPHFRTDLRLDSILWGCVAAFFLHAPGTRAKIDARFKEPAFYLGALTAVACAVFYSNLTGLWLPMLIPALLAGTVAHPGWRVSRVLDHALPARIGKMSYSLYLWQEIFLTPGWEPQAFAQKFPQNLILTFVCAFLSYTLLEKPCMEYGRRLAARRARPAAPASCGETELAKSASA